MSNYDGPNSRTLKLFKEHYVEADKPDATRFTWPAEEPKVEIDFILADRQHDWEVSSTSVVDESTASDHRPVTADLTLRSK